MNFCVVNICLNFDQVRLWWGLEVWQVSAEFKNKRNSGTHEVDENDDNTFIYIYIYIYIYINIYILYYIYIYILFIYSFIYLLFLLNYSNLDGSIR